MVLVNNSCLASLYVGLTSWDSEITYWIAVNYKLARIEKNNTAGEAQINITGVLHCKLVRVSRADNAHCAANMEIQELICCFCVGILGALIGGTQECLNPF